MGTRTRETLSLSRVSLRHLNAMAAEREFTLDTLQDGPRVAAARPYPWTADHTEPFHALSENVTRGIIGTTTLDYLAALFGNAVRVVAPQQVFYFSDTVLPECSLCGQPDAVVLDADAPLEPVSVLLNIELRKGPLVSDSSDLRKARLQTYATQVVSDSMAYETD